MECEEQPLVRRQVVQLRTRRRWSVWDLRLDGSMDVWDGSTGPRPPNVWDLSVCFAMFGSCAGMEPFET